MHGRPVEPMSVRLCMLLSLMVACGRAENLDEFDESKVPECDVDNKAPWLETFSHVDPLEIEPPYKETADPFIFGAVEGLFESQLAGQEVNYLIWLPPSYETEPERRYPVVYYLPGSSGRPFQVGAFLQDLGPSIGAGIAPEMIVVGVNGISRPTFYVDAADGEILLESMIIEELIPHVDAAYRTRGDASNRAVEGYSIGGYGALHLALAHPGTFAAATSLSGFVFGPRLAFDAEDDLLCQIWSYWLDGDLEYARSSDVFFQLENASVETLSQISVRIGYGDRDKYPFVPLHSEQIRSQLVERGFPPKEFVVAEGLNHSDVRTYEWLGASWFAFYEELFSPERLSPDP